MAHILKIIPNGLRRIKKVQVLSCMQNDTKNIQKRISCAAKAKQKLDADIFEKEKRILNSITAK